MPIPTKPFLRKRTPWWALLFTCTYIAGCSDNAWQVDPEDVSWNLPWKPVHASQQIQEWATDSINATHWDNGMGVFATVYTETIMRLGPVQEASTDTALRNFALHPDIIDVFQAIDSTCGSAPVLTHHERVIRNAFKRLQYHFPDIATPQLIWMNSGFNFAVYPTPSHLGVGMEWFLGSAHPLVQNLAPELFPQFMREKMHPERMSATAMRGWLLVRFSDPWYASKNCSEELLYWGKVLFIMQQIMPKTHPALCMDWSITEWNWAVEHEQSIWLELQPQEQLFESNSLAFGRWFQEGPFTRAAGIPQESPDRLGVWIGWRIVEDYMNDHPETSLQELMQMTEPLPFLKAYRPER